jgi:outer membrane protein OmpA-like peptidoglycan-associated protein
MKTAALTCTLLLLLMLLLSCSSNRSLVVLLPDPDGKVGQVEVTTGRGVQKMDQAYHAIEAGARDDPPSPPAPIESRKIESVFGHTLAAQPDPRFRFWTGTLYCKHGSEELAENSGQALKEIIKEFKKTAPSEIYLIGHADRVGPEQYNVNLSHRRAARVKQNLVAGGIKSKILLISFYGESKPQVFTEDEIREPLNRRVELVAKLPKP